MYSVKPIYQYNLVNANGFFNQHLTKEQLCSLCKVEVVPDGEGVQLLKKDSGEVLAVVPDDRVHSGKAAINMALAAHLTAVSGVPITPPTSFRKRALAFSELQAGPTYSDYIKVMNGVGLNQTEVEVTMSEDWELSLTAGNVAPNTLYAVRGMDSAEVIEIITIVVGSGLPSRVKLAAPHPRMLSRLLAGIGPEVPHSVGDGGEHHYFGKDPRDVSPLVPGPENPGYVADIAAALAALELDADEVREALGDHELAEEPAPMAVMQPLAAAPIQAGPGVVPPLVYEPAPLQSLTSRGIELANVLIKDGEGVTSSDPYKAIKQKELFGNRQKTSGSSLIRCLATQVATWRTSVDMQHMALEDTIGALAKILTQDQRVNQDNDSVKDPKLAALIIVCKSSNVYRMHKGAVLNVADGKHYPKVVEG